jgi:hypothetical protein
MAEVDAGNLNLSGLISPQDAIDLDLLPSGFGYSVLRRLESRTDLGFLGSPSRSQRSLRAVQILSSCAHLLRGKDLIVHGGRRACSSDCMSH